jgi:hypothetical protein
MTEQINKRVFVSTFILSLLCEGKNRQLHAMNSLEGGEGSASSSNRFAHGTHRIQG